MVPAGQLLMDVLPFYEGDATYKAAIDKALKPVGLSGMFGKGGYNIVLPIPPKKKLSPVYSSDNSR